jgi:hypothetical protein
LPIRKPVFEEHFQKATQKIGPVSKIRLEKFSLRKPRCISLNLESLGSQIEDGFVLDQLFEPVKPLVAEKQCGNEGLRRDQICTGNFAVDLPINFETRMTIYRDEFLDTVDSEEVVVTKGLTDQSGSVAHS